MKIRRLAIIVSIAGLLAIPARAAEHSAELWHVTRVTDPASGKFNYCAVENGFDNGLYLAFARNRDFNTNIVVSFPDKRLQEHMKYRMLVGIDSYPVRDTIGFSAAADILVLPLQHDHKVLEWLQKGKLLTLQGPQDSVKFSLDGAQEGFRKLQKCVEDSLKDEAQGIKPVETAAAPGDIAKPVSEMVMPLPLPASKAVGSPSVEPASTAAAEPAQTAVQPIAQPAVAPVMAQPAQAAPLAGTDKATPAAQPDMVVADAAPSAPPAPPAAPPPVAVSVAPQPKPVAPAETQPMPVQSRPAPAAAAPVQPVRAVPVPASGPAVPNGTPHVSLARWLSAAHIAPSGKCTDKATACTWSDGSVLGAIVQKPSNADFLDAIEDDADRHEKECHGQFSSSVSAPVASGGLETAESTFVCKTGNSAVSDIILYVQAGDRLTVADDSAALSKQGDAVAERLKLRENLPQATNYQ